jgi:hypothetical protein
MGCVNVVDDEYPHSKYTAWGCVCGDSHLDDCPQ